MVLSKLQETQKDLNNLEQLYKSEFQSYIDLAETPLNKVFKQEGYTKEKIYQDDGRQIFTYEIEPNTQLTYNWHNCREIVSVIEGECTEMVSEKVLKTNDAHTIKRGQIHSLKNTGDTTLKLITTLYKKLE